MFKRNKKFLWLLSTLTLAICTLVIGVWSAKQVTANISGTITFRAIGVEATVQVEIVNAKECEGLPDNKITLIETFGVGTAEDIAKTEDTWAVQNLTFDDDGTPIEIVFMVTNISTIRPLYAKMESSTDIENLDLTVTQTTEGKTSDVLAQVAQNSGVATFRAVLSPKDVYNEILTTDGTYELNMTLSTTELTENAINLMENRNLLRTQNSQSNIANSTQNNAIPNQKNKDVNIAGQNSGIIANNQNDNNPTVSNKIQTNQAQTQNNQNLTNQDQAKNVENQQPINNAQNQINNSQEQAKNTLQDQVKNFSNKMQENLTNLENKANN